MRDPERYVDRPVFLVGNQGDGLTLVSRMLRRGGELVSVSGGRRYWSGADEMHRAMAGYLPSGLSSGGRFIGGAPRHPVLTPPRSWSYASDDLLAGYRRTAGDANAGDRKRLMRAIAGAVRRHGKGRPVRFVDKSQTYTVRLGYLNRLLEGTEPAFVLVTRDPYASIYRAATGKAGDMERYRARLSLEERFELCIQHWENSMRCVEEDEPSLDTFTTVRFEDFLAEPERSLRDLCGFLDLEFRRDMIPAAGQQLPFGTRFETRWYPLRAGVNDRYRSSIPGVLLERLVDRIGERAATMGYRPPDRS